MGYQIYMREVDLRIRKENFEAALKALKEAFVSDRTWTEHLKSLEDAMSDFGYIPEYDEDGSINGFEYEGKCLRGDYEFWTALAPYVEEGCYLEVEGVGFAQEFDQENNTQLVSIEVQLLGFDVDIAGQNIIQDDILYKRALVILFIIEIFDIAERDSQKFGHLLCHLIFTLNEYDIIGLGPVGHRAIGIAATGDNITGIAKLITYTLTDLTNFNKLRARDDNTVFIYNADNAINRIFHLVNNTLKQPI